MTLPLHPDADTRPETAPVSPSKLDDAALIAAYRSGDSKALETLYAHYYPIAVRYSRSILSHPQNAEDVTSEAFTKCLEAISRGKGPEVSFGSYLIAAVRSVVANQGRNKDVPIDDLSLQRILEEEQVTHHGAENGEQIVTAFNQLPEHYRNVIWLKDIAGFTVPEISRQVDKTVASITLMHQRAKVQLRVHYLSELSQDLKVLACETRVSELAKFASGTLAPSKRAALAEHVDGCEECQYSLRNMKDAVRRFAAIMAFTTGSAVFAQSLFDAEAAQAFQTSGGIAEAIRKAALKKLLIAGGAAVTGLGVVTLAVFFLNQGSHTIDEAWPQHIVVDAETPRADIVGPADAPCTVFFERENASMNFIVENTGTQQCSATFDWDNERSFTTGDISGKYVFNVSRTGNYTVSLHVAGTTQTAQVELR